MCGRPTSIGRVVLRVPYTHHVACWNVTRTLHCPTTNPNLISRSDLFFTVHREDALPLPLKPLKIWATLMWRTLMAESRRGRPLTFLSQNSTIKKDPYLT